jgi:hypothetical protein
MWRGTGAPGRARPSPWLPLTALPMTSGPRSTGSPAPCRAARQHSAARAELDSIGTRSPSGVRTVIGRFVKDSGARRPATEAAFAQRERQQARRDPSSAGSERPAPAADNRQRVEQSAWSNPRWVCREFSSPVLNSREFNGRTERPQVERSNRPSPKQRSRNRPAGKIWTAHRSR